MREEFQAEMEQAQAWLYLGLPDQALATLKVEPDGMHPDPGMDALRFLCLEQMQTPSEELGQIAARSLAKHGYTERAFELATLHLVSSDQYRQALRLYDSYPDQRFPKLGEPLQNRACAETQMGLFDKALESVFRALSTHLQPEYILLDGQLTPLWRHFSAADHSPQAAELLVSPQIRRLADRAARSEIVCSVCGYEMKHTVPKVFVPFLVRDFSSHFRLAPDAPATLRRRFGKWRQDCFHRNRRLLCRAIHRAKELLKTRSQSEQQLNRVAGTT